MNSTVLQGYHVYSYVVNRHYGSLLAIFYANIFQDCDVNIKSLEGHTPLHAAVVSGVPKSIEKLIGHGAGVNAKDNKGNTPLHLLQMMKNREEIQEADDLPELMKVSCSVKASSQNRARPCVVLIHEMQFVSEFLVIRCKNPTQRIESDSLLTSSCVNIATSINCIV